MKIEINEDGSKVYKIDLHSLNKKSESTDLSDWNSKIVEQVIDFEKRVGVNEETDVIICIAADGDKDEASGHLFGSEENIAAALAEALTKIPRSQRMSILWNIITCLTIWEREEENSDGDN